MSSFSIIKKWILIASEYAGAKFIIKGVSAGGAFLLINILPIEEYGVYTLFLATLTFLNGFSDFGATNSLLYFWRRAKKRGYIFSNYLNSVFRLRRSLFLGSAVLSLFYLLGITYVKKYEELSMVLGSVLMVAAAWSLMISATWAHVLRIENRFRQSYAVEAAGELAKLVAVMILWLFGLKYSWAAMSCVLVGALISSKVSKMYADSRVATGMVLDAREVRKVDRVVCGQVIPTIPWTIFFAVQGPLVAWLAAVFGTVSNLAEVGALGRIGAVIGLISGFTVSVVVPKLSHVDEEMKYLRYYVVWSGILLITGVVMLMAIWKWPDTILLVLGDQYKGLHIELLIASATAVIMTFEYFAGAVNRSRGWIHGQSIRIGIIVLGQLAMAVVLDFKTTIDLLFFGFGTAVLAMLVQVGFNVVGFSRIRVITANR